MLGALASCCGAGGIAGAGEVVVWGSGRGSRGGFWAGMGPWNISSVVCMHWLMVRPVGTWTDSQFHGAQLALTKLTRACTSVLLSFIISARTKR